MMLFATRRLGRPSSRLEAAVAFVEVNHAVQFGSLQILAPDGLLLLVRGFDACRFRCSNFWPVDRQHFGQHAAIHRPGRFDAQNPQDGRRDIHVAGGQFVHGAAAKSGPAATRVLCMSNRLSVTCIPWPGLRPESSQNTNPAVPLELLSGDQWSATTMSGALGVLMPAWSSVNAPATGLRVKSAPLNS